MAKTFRRRDLDDDEDETLQDGKAVRLPMMMRDSRPPHWQDAADKYFENRAANSRVTGITGMPRKSLHQPGFRFSDANANKAALDAAYRAEAEYLENAWKGADKEGYAPTSEGMTCTVQAALIRMTTARLGTSGVAPMARWFVSPIANLPRAIVQ